MFAVCGLVCSDCPAFVATQKDDDEERKRVAEKWSAYGGEKIEPEDINCDGCIEVGKKLFQFCNTCEVRLCAFGRSAQNCAYCADYPCAKLNSLWESMHTQDAKNNLDEIRKAL